MPSSGVCAKRNSLKLEEVAEKLGLAPSTLSRIETGKAPTKSAYLTAMLAMYGVEDPGVRKVLVDMAREGHRKGWWSIYDDVLPSGFDIYVGLEAERPAACGATRSDVVHGLLQTTDYALAVLRELRPRDSEEQLERVVDLRMQRQRLLDADPPLDAVDHPRRGRDQAENRRGQAIMRPPARAPDPGQPVAQRDPAGPFLRNRARTPGWSGPFSILEFPSGPILRLLTPNPWAA